MATERSFLKRMEEYGFLDHIYDHLPEDFTAVFEIARIIESQDSDLHRKLDSVLRLPTLDQSSKRTEVELFQPEVVTGEEYEADFIRNRRDIARIYSWQFMLPQELFDQRLAERTLWMPVSKAPKILPVQQIGESFSFDSRKQKVFILFDTSASMRAHHRFHLAKSILIYFLERNKEDLGFISLRTFDDTVGELHTAVDAGSYSALIRHVLRHSKLGNGTVLQKALLTAIDDIEQIEHLAGAEILVITDGAVALDEPALRARIDDTTKIHTIKIGHAQTYASDKQIDDLIAGGKIGNSKIMGDLMQQERELRRLIDHTSAIDRKVQYEGSLRTVRASIESKKKEFAEEYRKIYGHELERLSSVYVEIDDIDDFGLFAATEDAIEDIELLVRELEEDANQFFTPELMKKMAVLHDHVSFLLQYEKDPTLRERLEKLDERLRTLLEEAMNIDDPLMQSLRPNSASQRMSLPVTDEDIRDLHFLLEFDGAFGKTQLLLLLRYMIKVAMKGIRRVVRRS